MRGCTVCEVVLRVQGAMGMGGCTACGGLRTWGALCGRCIVWRGALCVDVHYVLRALHSGCTMCGRTILFCKFYTKCGIYVIFGYFNGHATTCSTIPPLRSSWTRWMVT